MAQVGVLTQLPAGVWQSPVLGLPCPSAGAVVSLVCGGLPSFLILLLLLVKDQLHARHRLRGGGGGVGLLERKQTGWVLVAIPLEFEVLVEVSPHQEQRQGLRGRQTGSVRGVDPQQVVGGDVQVMVSMGGGKHAHLRTQEASAGRKRVKTKTDARAGAKVTCLSSSTAPTFSSSALSSRRRRCTVPSISPGHKRSGNKNAFSN